MTERFELTGAAAMMARNITRDGSWVRYPFQQSGHADYIRYGEHDQSEVVRIYPPNGIEIVRYANSRPGLQESMLERIAKPAAGQVSIAYETKCRMTINPDTSKISEIILSRIIHGIGEQRNEVGSYWSMLRMNIPAAKRRMPYRRSKWHAEFWVPDSGYFQLQHTYGNTVHVDRRGVMSRFEVKFGMNEDGDPVIQSASKRMRVTPEFLDNALLKMAAVFEDFAPHIIPQTGSTALILNTLGAVFPMLGFSHEETMAQISHYAKLQ